MFGSLTCRNGHTWAPGSVPASFGEDRCPHCGAPTRSPDVVGRRAWITLGLVEAALVAALVSGFLFWRPPGPQFPHFPVFALLVGLAVFGLPSLVLLLTFQQDRARRLETVCRKMGLAFTGQLSPARLKALGPFPVLRLGEDATALHGMAGPWEEWCVALLELRGRSAYDEHTRANRTAVIVTGPAPPAGPPRPQLAKSAAATVGRPRTPCRALPSGSWRFGWSRSGPGAGCGSGSAGTARPSRATRRS
ncbi:MAG TPA: hypothetical protein VFE78_30140, partial [Gemmataceae bacterium]|nr:hypothetical protein [Gemmataceae bacterium]